MKTPKHTFQIRALPIRYVTPCQARRDQEAQGLLGFHRSDCPHCKYESAGWELWGENGHMQGRLQDVSAESIKRAEISRSASGPVKITVEDIGFTYLR